ncbi:response regulator transcription factor [Leifsonia sp. Root227]|uniref:response regulator transcription factor n=2 Tax=unclassified Leifsonia TaxID=2663824 RepID=UPI0009EAF27A|nr:response regulator transcription factor [Leifsonia sp. Root227]
MTIRVGIVEDHPAMMLGTIAIVNAQPDLRVVAAANSIRQVLALREFPDVVLLDLSLSDDSSPFANTQLLAAGGARVLAYTSGDRPELVRDAARAGAVGMIRKTEQTSAIVDAVRTAARGGVVAGADWAAALEGDRLLTDARLTPRESEVLALYASGATADHVAELLYLSRDTVTEHISNIRKKYLAVDRSAPTKVDLFRRAVEDGLVDSL